MLSALFRCSCLRASRDVGLSYRRNESGINSSVGQPNDSETVSTLTAFHIEDDKRSSRNSMYCKPFPTPTHWSDPFRPVKNPSRSYQLCDFELIKVLGVGTSGTVRLAKHCASNAFVALKIISKRHILEHRQEKHLLRERSVHSTLSHPFIANLYGTFQDPHYLYFVLQHLPGGDLWRYVYGEHVSMTEKRKGIPEDHAVFYLGCVLLALAYLHDHAHVLYRDLKLENIALDADGYPKLVDFGFADFQPPKSAIRHTFCGSIDYMPPEILQHHGHDHRADIWSYGVLMYELLHGRTPFYHENAYQHSQNIVFNSVKFDAEIEALHPQACDLISKILVKNPDDRITSMDLIRLHPFFTRYYSNSDDWSRLWRREWKAPFIPFENQSSISEDANVSESEPFSEPIESDAETDTHVFHSF
uniref:cAMPdependent protein kinase catalytic subunit alpha putative n=1 Tax=Albugo laibachii Nc14 TaxID=890382 RepID=F0WTD0_9STRA|nr:cAMPdependent protein kinase catalytic subunit alpha putative [Albugo laibachii Nc14]|eukprot:CCA24620.1 cAMPdependent protein kinase catalytic subunit alpha putative [Albugo laibachii Nc14]